MTLPALPMARRHSTESTTSPPANEAFVNGARESYGTAEFAVASIQGWWDELGHVRYPEATSLFIPSDSGGSHSAVSRLYKVQLQAWADATGLEIHVSHYPPGTS